MNTEAVVLRCHKCPRHMRVVFEKALEGRFIPVTFSCAGCGASMTVPLATAAANAVRVEEFSSDSNQGFDLGQVCTVVGADGATYYPVVFHHLGGSVTPCDFLWRAPLPETIVFGTSPQETRGYRLYSTTSSNVWYSESEYLNTQLYEEIGRRLDAAFPGRE